MEKYISPEIEIIEFESVDVVVTSTYNTTGWISVNEPGMTGWIPVSDEPDEPSPTLPFIPFN